MESPTALGFVARPAPRIFMSHSHKDDEFGLKLLQDLRRALGDVQAVWYDASGGLDGGDTWWPKIVAEITRRPVFIVILSPDAMESPWVLDEIGIAWNQKNTRDGKRIIPVLARPTEIREDLKTLQVVSFLPPESYDSALTKLIGAIKRPFGDEPDNMEQAEEGVAEGRDGALGDADRPSWRTQPEISPERQAELAALMSLLEQRSDSETLQGVSLTRADIEWLIVRQLTSPDEQTPLDLRGADLRGIDLSGMPLEGVRLEGADLADAHLERANLRFAHLDSADLIRAYIRDVDLRSAYMANARLTLARLEGANLGDAHLENALLTQAHFEGAWLGGAHLERSDLRGSHLEGATLYAAHLTEASLVGAHLEGADLSRAHLEGVDLRRASFDARTDLTDAMLGGHKTGPLVDNVNWGGTNLAVVDWSQIRALGDTMLALQLRTPEGKRKDRATRVDQLSAAFRANRQLAVALRGQGLSSQADRFTYASLTLQQRLFAASGRYMEATGLALLGVIAGYGYKPMRSVIAYIAALLAFADGYYFLQGAHSPHLSILDALIVSVTVFHGRAFFVELFTPGDMRTAIAALEGIIGLLVEVTFVATFTQRFLSH